MNIWFILIALMVLGMIVQAVLKSKFQKYSYVNVGMTGAEVARKMLNDNGIHDVDVRCVEGVLTDHYHPTQKVVNLSRDVYYGNGVSAAAVAAHECGHAVQHAHNYAPLAMRSALVPVVNVASSFSGLALLIGLFLLEQIPMIFTIGVVLFSMTTLFSVITLPVEVNASNRAIEWLEHARITDDVTTPMAVDALKWAAYTYVIAALSSIATLLYYIGLARRD